MNEYQKRFVALLKTIFELDKSDLDFGIYRIINIRQREIVDYFENRLPKKIQEILAPFANGKTDEIKQKLAKIESDVESMGMTIDALQDNTPKKQEYIALLKQLSQGADMSALESDVYSALYSFFNRYYHGLSLAGVWRVLPTELTAPEVYRSSCMASSGTHITVQTWPSFI